MSSHTLRLIKFCSLKQAEQITSNLNQPTSPYAGKSVLISILSPLSLELVNVTEAKVAPVLVDHKKWLQVKKLEFFDVESTQPWAQQVFTSEMADAVVSIVRSWRCYAEIVVVHCEAGASRSAGMARALAEFFNVELDGKEQRALPEKHTYTDYNKLVYAKMKAALDRSFHKFDKNFV